MFCFPGEFFGSNEENFGESRGTGVNSRELGAAHTGARAVKRVTAITGS